MVAVESLNEEFDVPRGVCTVEVTGKDNLDDEDVAGEEGELQ